MTPQQQELWQRLRAFEVDAEGVEFTFVKRLARENGWTVEFSELAFAEYKKFVFLALCAGHPVTPSDEIDQVWHLHLTYTQSYWDSFCKTVLQQPLHHNPTKGGQAEDDKFTDWYARTKASYAQFFGTAPPCEVWPTSADRFDRNNRFQRVNLSDYWMLPRLLLHRSNYRQTTMWGSLIVLPTMLMWGTLAQAQAQPNPRAFGFFVVILIVMAAFYVMMTKSRRGRKRGRSDKYDSTRDNSAGSWWWYGCSSGCGTSGCSGSGCSSGCSSGCGGSD
jgi:hypothetical protein